MLKDGTFFTYYLAVIDRHSGMHTWLRKHQDQERYLKPEDSPNIVFNGTDYKHLYRIPEIRVDRIYKVDFIALIQQNHSLTSGYERDMDLEYLQIVDSAATVYKNKKGVVALDSEGYMNYFITNNYMKSF